MERIIQQGFSVDFAYPVVFTTDVFDVANNVLRDILAGKGDAAARPRWMAVIDDGVGRAMPELAGRLVAYMRLHLPVMEMAAPPLVLPGGEQLKSDRPAVERLVRLMAEARIDRHSYVLAVGGGALLDAVGYAASLVHRGVRLVRVPTTALSQDDGGVGVKTAINDPAGKNFLGTFAPPFAVINDRRFLVHLPDEHWRSGIAEAFKVAMIKDGDFFDWLCGHASTLAARDLCAMEQLVYRCAELHLRHIRSSGDPFELGRARPLDFGHWSAHQLELLSGYALNHGAAVAIGIMLDSLYALRSGWIDEAIADRLFGGLLASGFTLWHPALEMRDPAGRLRLFEGIDRFREHLGGTLCITMPHGRGRSMEVSMLDESVLASCLVALHEKTVACSR